MLDKIKAFNVNVTTDVNTGLLDVKGDAATLWKVVQFIESQEYINDGEFAGLFGSRRPTETDINRILVFDKDDNHGFIPLAM